MRVFVPVIVIGEEEKAYENKYKQKWLNQTYSLSLKNIFIIR